MPSAVKRNLAHTIETAYGENMANGPIVLLRVGLVLGHAQDLKLPRKEMAVHHVLDQQQRQRLATLMNAQVMVMK
jgi:hypothetical protein